MPLGNGIRNAELRRVSDLIGLQRADGVTQLLGGNRAHHQDCIGKWPATVSWVQLGNLCVNRLHVRAATQAGEHIPKGIHSGMFHQVASNRARVVIAVEESLHSDNVRLGLSRQFRLKCSTLRVVHREWCQRCVTVAGLGPRIVPHALSYRQTLISACISRESRVQVAARSDLQRLGRTFRHGDQFTQRVAGSTRCVPTTRSSIHSVCSCGSRPGPK